MSQKRQRSIQSGFRHISAKNNGCQARKNFDKIYLLYKYNYTFHYLNITVTFFHQMQISHNLMHHRLTNDRCAPLPSTSADNVEKVPSVEKSSSAVPETNVSKKNV